MTSFSVLFNKAFKGVANLYKSKIGRRLVQKKKTLKFFRRALAKISLNRSSYMFFLEKQLKKALIKYLVSDYLVTDSNYKVPSRQFVVLRNSEFRAHSRMHLMRQNIMLMRKRLRVLRLRKYVKGARYLK